MIIETRPLPAFEYVAPASLAEALGLLAEHGGAAKLLAGGTDLLPRMKKRKSAPSLIIDLNRVTELSFIAEKANAIHIGGGTALSKLYDSPLLRERAGALFEAVRVMSSPGIRNRATLAGNLCNASRCADTPAPLLALDAAVKLSGRSGERIVAMSDFFTGPETGAKTVTQADEVLTEVIIPVQRGRSTFIKLGRRKGSSTAIVCAAAYAAIADGVFEEVRVALNAVGMTSVRSPAVETALRGAPASEERIAKAAALIKGEIDPIGDDRASSNYRKEMAAVVIKRALSKLAIGEQS